MSRWRSDAPQHNHWVEVEDGGTVIIAKAIHGSDGVRPHWVKQECGGLCHVSSFGRWREIED